MFLLGRLSGFNLTGDAWLHCDKMNDKVYCFNFTEGFKENVKSTYCEQVDILISKNQALQILYLKHCVYKTTQLELPWIRNLQNPQKFILNNHSI